MADNLSFDWELRGKVEEQIRAAAKDMDKFGEAVRKLNVDLEKVTAEKLTQNISKNVNDAEKALYKLIEAKEKADKAMSRNNTLRNEELTGFDDSRLAMSARKLDEIIERVMNIGAEAILSKTAVKDLMSSLGADTVLKSVKSGTSDLDKQIDKHYKEQAKAQKEADKELAKMEKEAAEAALRNASAQEHVKNALSKIATARANLSAASEKGNQQEIAHAQLLMSLLDRLAGKLNNMKGTFLGEKGALSGVLGSGYQGLMRNVSAAIRDIGKVGSAIPQAGVDLLGGREGQLQRIQQLSSEMTTLQKRLADLRQEEQRGVFRPKDVESLQNRYAALKTELDGIIADMRRLGEMSNVYGGLGHLRGYAGPQSALNDEAWASARREAEIREVAAQAAEKHRQKLAELTAAFDRQAKAEEKERQAQAQATAQKERATQAAHRRAQASAETQRNLNKEASEVVRLRLEMLKTQAVQLQGLIKKGKGLFDTAQLEQYKSALRDIAREITTLKGVINNIGSFTGRNGSGLMSFANGANYSPLIAHGQQALEASKAVNILSDSERRFVESLSSTSSALRNHGVLLRDIQMMATQYLSIWGAKTYLDKIIETGGLLEQQRLSIGAILGSMDKAENIFSKIKALAVKSPFGVVELDKMSKQLTAYGFEYEELFDWTKRLADISAATGTEVSRLALALGHVRSEGALSGYTLRQFAMGNVPMLQKLAENLNISTKEVRERTRKKQIGYDDVKEVLRQLTDEGGMFYNAQEVMSEALNAKFKNLRDAFDIMYGEIAESGVGDILKGIAETLTAGAKQWQRYGTDILFVASAFGLAKAASAAYSTGMTTLMRQYGVLALNTRAYNAAQVQQMASEGAITRAHLLRAVASGRLSVEQARLAGATLGVSEATLRQVASSGSVQKHLLGNAMATSRYTVAQLRLMATLKAQGASYPAIRVGLMGVAAAVRSAAAAFKSFVPFLAIGAVVDFFSRYSQQVSAAESSAHEAASSIAVGLGNIKSAYDDLKKNPPKDDQLAGTVENLKEVLQENGAYAAIDGQIQKAQSLNEQYSILYGQLQKVSEAYVDMKYRVEAYLASANKSGGTWFTDNFAKDVEQYGQTIIKKDVAHSRASQYGSIFKKELEAMLKEEGKWVESTMRSADWESLLELVEPHKLVGRIKGANDLKNFFGLGDADSKKAVEAAIALKEYSKSLRDVSEAQKEVDSSMPDVRENFLMALKEETNARGLDMSNMINWSDEDLRTFMKVLDTLLSTYNIPEEAKQHLRDEILTGFPRQVAIRLKAIPDRQEVGLLKWQEELQAYFDSNKIEVKLSADDSIQSVEKRLQEARKKAQEKMDSAGAILMKLNITPDFSAIEEAKKKYPLLANYIERAFQDYTESKTEVNKIDQAHKDTGLSVVDDKKKKKGSGSGGHKEDKLLKQWQERKKALDEYYRLYKEYSQYMTTEEAFDRLNKTGLLSGQSLPKNIGDYLQVLKDFRDSIGQKNIKGTERKKFWDGLIGDINKQDFEQTTKKAADAFIKQMERELKEQGKRWDLYRKLLDATGSRAQSSQIAFGGAVGFDNQAEQLRSELEKSLAGNAKAYGLSLDDILDWDDEKLRSQLDIFKENTNGVYQKLMALKDAMQKVKAEEVDLLVDALKNAKNLDTELSRIRNKYNKSREAIKKQYNGEDRDRLLQNADKNEAKELSDKEWEYFKKEEEWGRVFSNLSKMSTQTLLGMRDKLTEVLPKVNDSVEATKALYEALDKIDKVVNGRNPFKAMSEAVGRSHNIRELLHAGASDYGFRNERGTYTIGDSNARKLGLTVKKSGEYTKEEMEDADRDSMEDFSDGLNGLTKKFKAVQDALTPVIDLFDSLGMTSLKDFFSIGSNALGAAAQMGSGAASLFGTAAGPWGAAAGAALSVISSIAAMHDKAMQKDIEDSKLRVKIVKNMAENVESALERTLGGIYDFKIDEDAINKLREYQTNYESVRGAMERMRAGNETYADYVAVQRNHHITEDTAKAVGAALGSGSYYDTKLAELYIQRDELKRQLGDEEDKKKSDSNVIEDYKQQISELDDQIKNFAIDMAKSLWDIDVKSWAKSLTDAIVGAWEKGEDAVAAYKDKVRELMSDLNKNILSKKVMEAALKKAGLDNLIAQLMEETDGMLDEGSVGQLAEKLNEAGEDSAKIITAVLDAMEAKGYVTKDGKSTSGSTSKVIQGGFTEKETGLLLSYISSMRADLSLQRSDVSSIRAQIEQWNLRDNVMAEAQMTQLRQIASNTHSNASSAAEILLLLRRATQDKSFGFKIS